MEAKDNSNLLYLQFQKDSGYPVFVRYNPADFKPDILNFLKAHQFVEVSKEDMNLIDKKISVPNARVLNIALASPRIAAQIGASTESDQFGPEKIIPRPGHRIYQYKGVGMMIYSFCSSVWELGVFHDFGLKNNINAYRTVITRFLSLALSPFGVVGLWGMPIAEGAVLLRQKDSRAYAVFIDPKREVMFSFDGSKKLQGHFQLIRLDSTFKRGRQIKMCSEEFISFMYGHASYFDYEGLSIPVRQAMRTVLRLASGSVCAKDDFSIQSELLC